MSSFSSVIQGGGQLKRFLEQQPSLCAVLMDIALKEIIGSTCQKGGNVT